MSPVLTVFWAKARMAAHEVAGVRDQSKLKVAVITVFATSLWAGIFFMLYFGFRWLRHFGAQAGADGFNIGDIIMVRMLGILALAVFFMLIFSNVLVSFSTLYKSREVIYLIQAPLTFRAFFLARFWECVGFSSWALAFLGSPLILAYGVITSAPWPFYVSAAAYFLPFVTIPACIGCIITLTLARVFPRQRMRVLVGLGIIAVLLLFLCIQDVLNATRLSQDAVLSALMDATSQTQGPFLPSSWLTRGILAAASGNYGECAFNFLLLLSNAMLLLTAAAELADKVFYPGFSYLVGQDRTRFRPLGKGVLGRLDHWFRWLPNPGRALVIKDIKLFWRDPAQWSQFVIFFGILAIYVANLHGVGSSERTTDMWRSWIACLNIGSCTLVLATLTSRFVFPLVSLEGRRFWILGLAPFTFRMLVWQKFWLSLATTSLFTVGLAVLSGSMLRIPATHFWLSVYSVAIANFGLAGLAVGLGALYPNFNEDNPARIVSGMGGTLNFLLSIGYIILVVGSLTVVLQGHALQWYAHPRMWRYVLAGALAFITALSAVATVVPMRLGLRNLRDAEF